jgi:type IV fimbrial biogenesis protein FimT
MKMLLPIHSVPSTVAPSRLEQSRGFTLIELMVTLSIAAILLGVGVPGFRSLILDQRGKTASYDVGASLMFTRSEAIKRNAAVVITPNSSSDWATGWNVTSGTTTLSSQAGYPTGVSVSGPASLTFGGDGRLTGSTAPKFTITSGTNIRCVNVDLSGLPKTKTITSGNC